MPAWLRALPSGTELAALATLATLPDGAEVHAEGAPARHWHLVVAGAVRLSRLTSDGRRCVAEFLLPGDIFGIEDGVVHAVSAEAACASLLARIPRRPAEALAEADPALASALRDLTLARFAHGQDRLLRLACLTATERVASFLVEMAERSGAGDEIRLPMGRGDIGDHLGLRPETVCRTMAQLCRGGAFAMPAPNRILVRDRAALEALALRDRRPSAPDRDWDRRWAA
jgi:CRP-like cAMP-binding protein